MGELPSSVSYTPLEVPAPIEAGRNYLDYWKYHQEADHDLYGIAPLQQAVKIGAEFMRDPDERIVVRIVGNWDKSLGSFNHMQHGAGDLARGAALLLRRSYQGNPEDFPVVRSYAPKDTVEAFLDVTEQLGDMADQRPARAMSLAGQLVHKAALIDPQPDRQAALLDTARTMYVRCYGADTQWNMPKILTSQRIADIDFHRLSMKTRQLSRARQGMKGVQREAAALLRNQAEDLLHYNNVLDAGTNPESVSGSVAELFTAIAVRHLVYLSPELSGNHSQIRTAFDSEEHPEHPRGTRLKRAFDLVYKAVDGNDHVVGARMWQMKTGTYIHEADYHPAIDVVRIQGVRMRDMFKTARVLRQEYARGSYREQVASLPLVTATIRPFMRPAAKAA